jgi:hypothetical protein
LLMKKLVVLGAIALTVLCLTSGCPQSQEEGPVGPAPDVGIYAASHTVMAGSSFMVCGEFFPPGQTVWVEARYGEALGGQGLMDFYDCAEADERGAFSLNIPVPVPEHIAPGDYVVEIYTGEDFESRQLFTKLPIRVETGEQAEDEEYVIITAPFTVSEEEGYRIPQGSVVYHLENGITEVYGPDNELILKAIDYEASQVPTPGGPRRATHVFHVPNGTRISTEGNVKKFHLGETLILTVIDYNME